MQIIDSFWQMLNNWDGSWLRYAVAVAIVLLSFVVHKIVIFFTSRELQRLAKKGLFADDRLLIKAIDKPLALTFILLAIYLALLICKFPVAYQKHLDGGFTAVLSCLILWVLVRVSDLAISFVGKKFTATDDAIALQVMPLLRRAFRVFLLIIGAIFIVQNIGVDVGSLLAGLGIGGLAVALAAQESLANFWGTLVLLVDRPFRVNDWVKINDTEGIIEEMGFRSTRIRTWQRSLVTLPNKSLANSTIENWTEMNKRRVRQVLAVTYQTKSSKIEKLIEGIEKTLADHQQVEQESILVKFIGFNESSLDILVQYFTLTTVYVEFLQITQENNCAFLELAEQLSVDFAFPSRTIYNASSGS